MKVWIAVKEGGPEDGGILVYGYELEGNAARDVRFALDCKLAGAARQLGATKIDKPTFELAKLISPELPYST